MKQRGSLYSTRQHCVWRPDTGFKAFPKTGFVFGAHEFAIEHAWSSYERNRGAASVVKLTLFSNHSTVKREQIIFTLDPITQTRVRNGHIGYRQLLIPPA